MKNRDHANNKGIKNHLRVAFLKLRCQVTEVDNIEALLPLHLWERDLECPFS